MVRLPSSHAGWSADDFKSFCGGLSVMTGQNGKDRLEREHDAKLEHLTPLQRSALSRLDQARLYAIESGVDCWQFAVEMSEFVALGLNSSDLRLLVGKGLVLHAVETTKLTDDDRSFRPSGRYVLRKRTCFVACCDGPLPPPPSRVASCDTKSDATSPGNGKSNAPNRCPVWNPDLHELTYRGEVVKHFRLPSRNQETVLAAFQEEGWPVRIDDPLPPKQGYCPKQRLSETIKSLNKSQKHQLVRFMGDGTGMGVRWRQRS